MLFLLAGLLLFIASHLIPTMSGVKTQLQGSLGESGYRAVFSLVSLVSLGLIIWGYGIARGDTAIWFPPDWLRHVTMLFMLPVFPLLIASNLPGQLKKKIPHPMLMAIKIWAFAHLLSNGDLASMIMFGAFFLYGVYALISAKKRERAGLITVKTGPARNDIIALVVGVAIYIAFAFWGHALLIGVPVVPV